jgi:hypothetical protein
MTTETKYFCDNCKKEIPIEGTVLVTIEAVPCLAKVTSDCVTLCNDCAKSFANIVQYISPRFSKRALSEIEKNIGKSK